MLVGAWAATAFADDTESVVFNYGQFTCEVTNHVENPSVAIINYDSRATTEAMIVPETVEYDGVVYSVVGIETENLLSRPYTPEKIVVPNSVTYIGASAFATDASSVTTEDIEFGENVNWIGEMACYGYSGNVHINSKIPPYVESEDAFEWIYMGNNIIVGHPNIFVPQESLDEYRNAEIWSAYKDNIYATGSINFIVLNEFNFSDGMETNSEKEVRIGFVNDTGLEIKSFHCETSNTNLLDASVLPKEEYMTWYTISLQTYADPGSVTVTAIAELEDGSIHKNEYELEIKYQPASIPNLINDKDSSITVYTLDGRKLAVEEGLEHGLYIVKEGNRTHKILVK